MRVLFLRHGESGHNAHTGEERLAEELGDVLTERGRAQAVAAGAGLRDLDLGITKVFTSPMRRAAETAERVARRSGWSRSRSPSPTSSTRARSGRTASSGSSC
jgi:broad specificity phosphatase PhoE